MIANQAVGDLLHCVYVDTGFMRKDETEQIEALLEAQGINLITVKAADRYFEALKGALNLSRSARSSVNCSFGFLRTSRKNAGRNTSSRARLLPTGLNPEVACVTPSSPTTTSAGFPRT